FLLQIDPFNTVTPDTVATAATQAVQDVQELSFFDILLKGGWVMLPLALLFFLGLVIFIERYITIRKASKNESNLMSQVKQSVLTGHLDSAVALCRNSNSPLGRMLQKGLLRIGRPIKDIEGAIENLGKLE